MQDNKALKPYSTLDTAKHRLSVAPMLDGTYA